MPDNFNLSDVFISYSRKDTDFARRLFESLKGTGREVWADWEDIPLTADWWSEIQAGIDGSDAFVFIISPDSVASDVCRQEIQYAVDRHKRFIPVLYRDLSKDDQPKTHAMVNSHNWIFFRESEDYGAAFNKLVSALETDLSHVRMHTRLLVRASEWKNRNKASGFLMNEAEVEEAEAWLSQSGGKQPRPTEIQADYILASRKQQILRNRRILAGVGAALVISLVLLVAAAFLGIEANNQRGIAEQNHLHALAARDEAQTQALVGASQLHLYKDADHDRAIAFALEAYKIAPDLPDVIHSLSEAGYSPGTRQVYQGEDSEMRDAAISPDGKSFLMNTPNFSMALYDIETGAKIRDFEPIHTNTLIRFDFSPDGSLAVSGSSDHTLILWDVATGKMIRQLGIPDSPEKKGMENIIGHTDRVRAVAFSPDGEWLLSGGLDRNLILWDVATGEEIVTLTGHEERVWSVAFSPDGETALSGDRSGEIIYWDLLEGEEISRHKIHSDRVQSIVFNPFGDYVFSAGLDRVIYGWELETGGTFLEMDLHTAGVTDLALNDDDTLLISASQDGSLILWDAINGVDMARYVGHTNSVNGVALHPDQKRIISASSDGTARLWDLFNIAPDAAFHEHTQTIYDVAISPDGKWALSASAENVLRLWDTQSSEELFLFGEVDNEDEAFGFRANVYSALFNQDGSLALGGDDAGTIIAWDTQSGEEAWRIRDDSPAGIWSMALNPAGKLLATANLDGTIELWDIETREKVQTLGRAENTDPTVGHTAGVYTVAFTRDGKRLLSGGLDNHVLVWNLEDGTLVKRMENHTGWVWEIAVSPDGKTALSASADSTILLWDLAKLEPIRRLRGHADSVLSVAYSPDGKYALSGGRDISVILWNIGTGEELRHISGHSDWVRSVAFSPDGKTAITAGSDTVAFLWTLRTPAELVEWIRENRYLYEFNCEERSTYTIEPLCSAAAANAESVAAP